MHLQSWCAVSPLHKPSTTPYLSFTLVSSRILFQSILNHSSLPRSSTRIPLLASDPQLCSLSLISLPLTSRKLWYGTAAPHHGPSKSPRLSQSILASHNIINLPTLRPENHIKISPLHPLTRTFSPPLPQLFPTYPLPPQLFQRPLHHPFRPNSRLPYKTDADSFKPSTSNAPNPLPKIRYRYANSISPDYFIRLPAPPDCVLRLIVP